jgi:hypothetical protein
MLAERTPRSIENDEEARAFLQQRVALFWKVMAAIMAMASVLGAVGALKRPGGWDLVLDIGLVVVSGACWWVLRRGRRSVRFSRFVEAAGLVLFFTGSSFIGRCVLIEFARERSLGTYEGALMADAYMAALGVVGAALMILVRAALIPSSPRRTILYTVLAGVPILVTPSAVVPTASGGFALRALDSDAFPWFPVALVIVWSFVVITSTVISRVIYGLRAEVREAKKLGQYVIERKIGEGGMGEVYRARHGMMRRPSALKLLRPDHASERDLARFEREVQLTARLTHPNTITLFDYGRTDDGVFYYAMELLDGANLQRIVQVSGPLPPGRVVKLLVMACGALSEAHGIGLIHRDIKPANIMLCSQGGEHDVVKILDFGLVKELAVEGDAGLSAASTMIGTPQYMAPENILAPGSVDARSDIYGLGAVMYFLLAGSELFSGTSIVEVCGRHLHQAPDPLAERGVTVPRELEAVVRDCLAKKPEDRPQSALELRRRLEACPVGPWDAEMAREWWLAHSGALEGEGAGSIDSPRTVAVDGRLRASAA